MKITVLGGGGFIGSQVAARLSGDHEVTVVVDHHFPELREGWWSKAAAHRKLDLREPARARQAVAGADFVFHFAADMGGVGYFHSSSDAPASQNNLRIDLNVLEACQGIETPFFYASSACALPITNQGHLDDFKLSEDLLGQGPADALYGEEKRIMALFCQKEPLARVGLLHTIYGPGQEFGGPRAKFPPAICAKVKRGGEIEIWGDGSQVRTFLYIDDAIDRILRVAFGPYEGPVNIGSDEEVSVRQCADWLCDYAGIEPDYRFDTSKPTGVAARACDNSKFNRVYGRLHTVPAREGLSRLFDWLP